MSKLLPVLLILTTFLALLLLITELEGLKLKGIFIKLVKDMNTYKAERPDGIWEPLENIRGVGFVLGNKRENDSLMDVDRIPVCYRAMKDIEVHPVLFPEEVDVTYSVLQFWAKVHRGRVALEYANEGMYASLVVEVPKSDSPDTLVVNAYARKL